MRVRPAGMCRPVLGRTCPFTRVIRSRKPIGHAARFFYATCGEAGYTKAVAGTLFRGGHARSEPEAFPVLIERVRAGDAEAAAELVRRYEPMVRRAARVRLVDPRLGRVLDSMDICQSVMASFFLRAALGQYELNSPDQLLKLLATMARNKLANQAHGQRGRRATSGASRAAETRRRRSPGTGRRRAGRSRHVNSSTRPASAANLYAAMNLST